MRSKSGGNSNVDQLRLMLSPSWAGNKSNVDTFTYWNVGRFPGCDHTGILVNFQTAPESYPFCSCTKLYMNRDSFVTVIGVVQKRDIFLEEIHLRDLKKTWWMVDWSEDFMENILWIRVFLHRKASPGKTGPVAIFRSRRNLMSSSFLSSPGCWGWTKSLGSFNPIFFGDDPSNLIMFQLGWNRQLICLSCCCLWIRLIERSFRGGMGEVDLR